VSKLSYLIKNNYEKQIENSNNKNNKTIKKINMSNLVTSLYSYDFYIKFFYNKLNKDLLDSLFILIIKYIYYKNNRSYNHICKRSNFMSYFKSYSINNKQLYK